MGKIIEITYQEKPFGAYLAEQEREVKGAVIVIHEVWGLVDHIKDIAERYAREGYIALAPDLLSETKIAEQAAPLRFDLFNPEKRNEAQPKLREIMAPIHEPGFAGTTVGKLENCFEYLTVQPGVNGRIAVNGFCFGGSYTYLLALHEPRLKAALPFYGHVTTDPEELKQIRCPVFAFYGADDHGLTDDVPEIEKVMRRAGVRYTARIYPDCGHAFFNDTNTFAYNGAAATDAWQRILAILPECFAG